jgi:hypothetical protein
MDPCMRGRFDKRYAEISMHMVLAGLSPKTFLLLLLRIHHEYVELRISIRSETPQWTAPVAITRLRVQLTISSSSAFLALAPKHKHQLVHVPETQYQA